MALDADVENVMKEENPQSIAVKSLINVKGRDHKKLETDIELKTDLTDNDVANHSVLAVLNHVLESGKDDFRSKTILGNLINTKERKLISKDRKGRGEIVDLAKTPEQPIVTNSSDVGMFKKLFIGKSERMAMR